MEEPRGGKRRSATRALGVWVRGLKAAAPGISLPRDEQSFDLVHSASGGSMKSAMKGSTAALWQDSEEARGIS